MKIEANSVRLIQLFFAVILFGLTLNFVAPEYAFIMPSIVPISLIVIALFMAFELQLFKVMQEPPVITTYKVGTYLLSILVVSLAILGVCGLFNLAVPSFLQPYAGIVTGLSAIISLLLMWV